MKGKLTEFFLKHQEFGNQIRFLLFEDREDLIDYALDVYGKKISKETKGITLYRSTPERKIVGEILISEIDLSVESLSHEIDHAVYLLYRWTQGSINLGKQVSQLEEDMVTVKSTFLKELLKSLYFRGLAIDPISLYIRRVSYPV